MIDSTSPPTTRVVHGSLTSTIGPAVQEAHTLRHVACIMDGNGRWAARRGLPRTAGHTEGEENLARLVRAAVHRDIGWLTVFGFSTENWRRPRPEVRHILGLHEKLFGRVRELNELNVRVQWIGRPFDSREARTPRYVQRAIRKAIADTANNTGMVLTVAFDYGGRSELVRAVEEARHCAGGVTSASIAEHLYLPELPPVDVLVRTSGERRVSNFLLWQAAGAAIYFTDATWPDFDAGELDAALALLDPPQPQGCAAPTVAHDHGSLAHVTHRADRAAPSALR